VFAPFGSIEAAQMTRAANFWKPLDTVKIKMCLMACANVQFRVQGHLVEFESRYVTLSIKRALKYGMGQLPPGNFYIQGAAFNVTHFESRITHLLYTAINTTERG
jgi:hypothetical protein